jgi:ABC-type transport system involved in multi-copper enzyme maturation permease subunit
MSTLAEDGAPHTDVPPSNGVAPAPGGGDPFRVFGIVGFVLSLFAILNFAGLAISVIALVRSQRTGFRNRFALAGVVIAGLGVLATLIIVAIVGSTLVDAAQTCARLGDGVHIVGNATYSCAPGSFYVTYPR